MFQLNLRYLEIIKVDLLNIYHMIDMYYIFVKVLCANHYEIEEHMRISNEKWTAWLHIPGPALVTTICNSLNCFY